MWVARDKSGLLALYTKRPVRSTSVGVWSFREGEFMLLDEDDPNFENLTWEDDPIEVWIKPKD
jgi:hypothetical protein